MTTGSDSAGRSFRQATHTPIPLETMPFPLLQTSHAVIDRKNMPHLNYYRSSLRMTDMKPRF